MGIDSLEIIFQLEKRLDIPLNHAETLQRMPHGQRSTVGDLVSELVRQVKVSEFELDGNACRQKVRKVVCEVLADVLDVEAHSITDDAELIADLGMG